MPEVPTPPQTAHTSARTHDDSGVRVRLPQIPDYGADVSCAICEAEVAEWVHQLDPGKSRFRKYGKGHVWASQVAFCDRCEDLYRAGDDEELVRLQVAGGEDSVEAIDEEFRKPLRVFREADTGAVELNDLLPPGAADLRAAGFTPVGMLTGEHEIARAWPPEYRRSVPETREGCLDDAIDGQFWLVRSPWSSVDIREVMALLWPWVYAREGLDPYRDMPRHIELVRQFLSLNESTVVAMRSDPDQA